MNKKKKIIALDFDGTIAHEDWNTREIKLINIRVRDFIDKVKDDFEIVIFSARNSSKKQGSLLAMKKFLDDNEIYYDRIAQKSEGKIFADYYIDDRAIQFKGNWADVYDEL